MHMKREEILFYMSEGTVSMYFIRSKLEKIIEVDTSLFFKFGEISDVEKCENMIAELLTKIKFNSSYLKPNLVVLYNDICYADLRYLYRCALRGFSYNTIRFVELSRIAKLLGENKNLVVFDKTYYTSIDRGEKFVNEENLGVNPIIIGKSKSGHIHYPDDKIVWKTFKSHFTNGDIYVNMDVGDDVL